MTVKIVTYNIQYATGRDGVVNLQRIVDEIAGADVIALQEVERFWRRSGNIDQPQKIAELLRDYFWVYGAGVDLHCADGDGDAHKNSAKLSAWNYPRRQFGNMLLSKTPWLHSRHHLLPKYGSTGPISIQRSALEATTRIAGRALRFYSVHLTHLSSATRIPQVEKLLQIHSAAAAEGAPIAGDLSGGDWSGVDQTFAAAAIMLGDFNFTPDAKEYEMMAGPLSDYGGRISNPCGFVDAWCAAGHDINAGHTSDVNKVPARLDYCFASAALQKNITAAGVDTTAEGSDHFPLAVELDLRHG